MKRTCYTEEQIAFALRQHDAGAKFCRDGSSRRALQCLSHLRLFDLSSFPTHRSTGYFTEVWKTKM